ncbi:MAG TPA: hypothetical protein VGM91_08500 [Conexibacter sp.]|jgi:hypothetical protein
MAWDFSTDAAFDALCERAVSVSAHGGPPAEKQPVHRYGEPA